MESKLVYRLPDSYAKPVRGREKETAVNTWRLFALNEYQQEQLYNEISRIDDASDIYKCTGETLDKIGEMYGHPRKNGTDDEAYRMELLAKIAGYFKGCSMNEVLEGTAVFCGTETGNIYFTETTPAMTALHIRSMEIYEKLPITLSKLRKIVEELLPVGVGLGDNVMVHGKFRYCAAGSEKNEELDGTGFNEFGAGFGTVRSMSEETSNFRTSDGKYIRTADGKMFNVKEATA